LKSDEQSLHNSQKGSSEIAFGGFDAIKTNVAVTTASTVAKPFELQAGTVPESFPPAFPRVLGRLKPGCNPHLRGNTGAAKVLKRMVARDGVEPPTPAFSGATEALLAVNYKDVEGCETPVTTVNNRE
jgi:hypothetical protein